LAPKTFALVGWENFYTIYLTALTAFPARFWGEGQTLWGRCWFVRTLPKFTIATKASGYEIILLIQAKGVGLTPRLAADTRLNHIAFKRLN
jgi:hypothetical protein